MKERWASLGRKTCDVRPSMDTPAGARERSPIRSVMQLEAGKTSGRKERLRGQMGVSTSAERDGCTIGPPAESEYAVEPVGVDMMRPSDTASVRC